MHETCGCTNCDGDLLPVARLPHRPVLSTNATPSPAWVKEAIDAWTPAAGVTEGTVFRAIDKIGHVWKRG